MFCILDKIDIASYADDNILYTVGTETKHETNVKKIFKWLSKS